MAKNQVTSTGEGRHITVPHATAVESGQLVLMADDGLHGVALADRSPRGDIVIDIGGIWMLPFAANQNITIGETKVYVPNANKVGGNVQTSDTTASFVGIAMATSANTGAAGTRFPVLILQSVG